MINEMGPLAMAHLHEQKLYPQSDHFYIKWSDIKLF